MMYISHDLSGYLTLSVSDTNAQQHNVAQNYVFQERFIMFLPSISS